MLRILPIFLGPQNPKSKHIIGDLPKHCWVLNKPARKHIIGDLNNKQGPTLSQALQNIGFGLKAPRSRTLKFKDPVFDRTPSGLCPLRHHCSIFFQSFLGCGTAFRSRVWAANSRMSRTTRSGFRHNRSSR